MKVIINIIIAVLVIVIAIEIEKNSVSNKLDYSNAICAGGILMIFAFLRYYINEFKSFLNEKK